MDIFLPIARMNISGYLILGLGGMVGLLSGIFGVGGGFLLTPLLMMFGIPPTVASASDSNQIVAASVSGTMAHSRMKNVDFLLGFILIAGGLTGGTMGTGLVSYLRGLGNFNFVLNIAYVVMLLVVGGFMFVESIQSMRKSKTKKPVEEKKSKGSSWLTKLPGKVYFSVSEIECSVITLFLIGILIGVLSALMGVGGGFIMLPIMIYLIGMNTMKAVGTSLFSVLFTSLNVTISQSIINGSVDVVLAMLLLIGSSIGAQIGVRVGKKMKAEQLRVVFSMIVLVMMVKMLAGLLMTPASLIVLGGGGN